MARPNIILLFADQMRGDCMRCDGNPYIETPNLDYLASLGTRFPHAYTATPSCIPARATLMTGMNQWHAGILGMGLGQGAMPNDYPHMLAAELSNHGYRTHLVGKGHFNPQRAMMGFQSHELDESGRSQDGFKSDYRIWFDRVKPYDDLSPDDHGVPFNSWMARPWHTDEHLHPSWWTMTRALEFVKNRDRTKPYFLNISFARPHSPYVPPRPYWDMYCDEELPPAAVGDWAGMHDKPRDAADTNAWHGRMTDRQIRRARTGYYGDVSFIDTQIGRLINHLQRSHDFANTMFVFAADHGDMLGDHNLWRKTYAYEGSARIPFIVVPPIGENKSPRNVAPEVVELRDIMPTILEAAGIEIPATVDGRSVLPLSREAAPDWREYIHGEHCWCYGPEQDMQYVTDGRRKYIWLPRIDMHQFFDLESDPHELHNCIDDPARREEVQKWRGFLVAELEARQCGWVKDGKLVGPETPDAPLISPWRDKRYQPA